LLTLYKYAAGSAEAVNQWRSATLTLLRREASQKMQAETAAVTEHVMGRINRVLNAVTDAKGTEVRDQALRALVATAVDLARMLVVQKAVFSVAMPEILPYQKVMFDPSTMEDIGGEDEDSLSQRDICCVTFPGIIKRGDENGGHLQYQNVIAKARVLCSPE
jgi:activating signal cointegrator complex subunit 1